MMSPPMSPAKKNAKDPDKPKVLYSGYREVAQLCETCRTQCCRTQYCRTQYCRTQCFRTQYCRTQYCRTQCCRTQCYTPHSAAPR